MDYSTYYGSIQNLAASTAPDTNFDQILPEAQEYAALRMQRDLNLLSTVHTDTSVILATATRTATVPSTFVVTQQVNVLTPAGSTATTGNRVVLTPVSLELMNTAWPGNSVTGTPEIWAQVDQWNIVVGPSPDANYTLEVVGTQRFPLLSDSQPTNFLSLYLPDMLIAATMIFISGYQRDFGAQASDPQVSSSWESQYGALLAGAKTEEAEKKGWASSWTSHRVSEAAQPQRG